MLRDCRALEALRNILEIGKRDMSNPKYDGYFDAARSAVESQLADVQPSSGGSDPSMRCGRETPNGTSGAITRVKGFSL